MQSIQLKTILGPWLLPPYSLLLLALLGLLVARRLRRTGLWITVLSLLATMALGLPVVADSLAGWVEKPYLGLDTAPDRLPDRRIDAARRQPGQAPQAIVVLSAGSRYAGADNHTMNALDSASLERVLHARRVARRTGLPILVTGGVPAPGEPAFADLMAERLSGELSQPVRWREIRARDTIENARYSREILARQGIERIVLVTHALHMRRAEAIFRAEGFTVIPAPHDFQSGPPRRNVFVFSPSMLAMTTSWSALREIVGLAWLRLRPWFGNP